MKLEKTLLLLLVLTIAFATTPRPSSALKRQSTRLYQQMSPPERIKFVAERARRIPREISGSEYEFTPEFETEIQKAVDSYVHRIGNNGGDGQGKGDARFILERGQKVAPTL